MKASTPASMKAIQLDEPNGPLVLREVPTPRPQKGQVLIRMAAAPVNPSDLGSVTGLDYSGKRKYPFTPGLEGSGTVVAAGEGLMPRLLLGRRVACSAMLAGDGTWAEYLLTSAQLCIPLNRKVSLEKGATLLVNPLTALALIEIARQGNHQAVVSTAAASALGGMLTRLGKRYKIPMIHIVRRQEQAALVRERGGEIVLNSRTDGFAEQLQKAAHQYHATLLLDAIGGEMTQQLADAAPYGSKIVLYARLSDEDAVINSWVALVKHLRFEGWFLSNWAQENSFLQTLQFARRAQSLLEGDLQTPTRARLPLAAAQQAIEAYANQMTGGKFLLVADPQAVPLEG